jgi:periplasmic copper chaperone A
MKKKITAGALALATTAAIAAPAADAHVTLQPNEQKAGGFTVLNVRVPNEKDDSGTNKVVVQFPDGFASASYEPVPGWKVKVTKEKAPKPIEQHGETINEQVDTVTFSGGEIAPGEFQDFPLSVRIPDGKAGDTLTFKALQTYDDGETVRWIEDGEDAEKPAPLVTLTAAEEEHGAAAANEKTPEVEATQASAASDDGDDGSSNGLAIAALIVGALGLAAGIAGFATARRARTA